MRKAHNCIVFLFYTSTAIQIIPKLWHSHRQVNSGLILIKIRIADPGDEQDLNLNLRSTYIIDEF